MSTTTADVRVDDTAAALDVWFASVADLGAKAFGWRRDRQVTL
jgi:hypothetical protein